MEDMDSNYTLQIKLLGNRKRCRQEFQCFSFDMVVDSDKSNYKDLHDSVVDKYPHGYLEVLHFQYYDEELKSFPEVKTDQDLMAMFERHSKKKVIIMFVVYRGSSDPYEPVNEWDFSDEAEPTREVNNAEEEDDDEYLRNPEPENEYVGVDEEDTYLDKNLALKHLLNVF